MSMQAPATIAPGWTDGKRRQWLLSLLPVLLPWVAFALVSTTGVKAFWWFGFLFTYGVIVPLELLIGDDPTNPPESAFDQLDVPLNPIQPHRTPSAARPAATTKEHPCCT